MSSLPKLMLIADGFASGRSNQSAEQVRSRVLELVERGVSFVQLRDHAVSIDLFRTTAKSFVHQIHEFRSDAVITTNSRDVIASELGCGLHLRAGESASLPCKDFQPCGYSAHNLSEVQFAERTGCDYATCSPVFSTPTHPGLTPMGIDSLRDTCASVPNLPILALGGISPERVHECLDSGAYGVAVLSNLLDAHDPATRLAAYRDTGVL